MMSNGGPACGYVGLLSFTHSPRDGLPEARFWCMPRVKMDMLEILTEFWRSRAIQVYNSSSVLILCLVSRVSWCAGEVLSAGTSF